MQTLASDRCADWLRRAARAALLVIGVSSFTVPGIGVSATLPVDGAWLIDGTGAAVQIFDCSGQLCGRIVWLRMARDSVGGWPATTRTRSGISTAPAVGPDRSSRATAGRS